MTTSWYWWGIFAGFVTLLLVSDLGISRRSQNVMNLSTALCATGLRVGLALLFNAGIYLGWMGEYETRQLQHSAGLEFLTSYLVELALSIDNVFVFALIFRHFRVDASSQHRVLFWGILGALVMRGFMIFVGLQILHLFHWVTYLFGIALIVAGIRMLAHSENHSSAENSLVERWVRRILPISEGFHGSSFFIRNNHMLLATPLLVVLMVIETTDLIFALDSIPAVLAVTHDGFIILTSNIFAILGLRAMYFALADLIDRFHFLHYGLSAILAFIGSKMLLSDTPFRIGTMQSLFVILIFLIVSIVASLAIPKRKEQTPAP